MQASDIERIAAFEHRFAKAQATSVVDLGWGYGLLQAEFPFSQEHNRIAVTAPVRAADVLAAAEDVLGGAELRHRYVSFDDELVPALSAPVEAAGYAAEPIMTMIYAGPGVEPGRHPVVEVAFDQLRPTIIDEWQATLPAASVDDRSQLADRTVLYARGADFTRLAVYEGDEIAAHADLFLDRVDSIAKFENLATREDCRGRGYGDALIRDALRRGRAAGVQLSALTADLNDWPREWYQRLGYVDAGLTHHFSRR